MPDLNTGRQPGRPRDDSREAEIVKVALEVLAERGYEGVSFEAVARGSGASKATLYRRWPSKRDMIVAAVKAGPAAASAGTAVDTGSLREDLLALCRRLVTTLRSADTALSLALLQAGLEDPELCEHLEQMSGPTGARLPHDVLERAIARRELPVGADPFAFEEIVGSVLLLRRLNGLPVEDAYLEQLIDTVVIPALQSSAQAGPLPRGIFSGAVIAEQTIDSKGEEAR